MSKASSGRFLIVAVAFLAHTACSDDSSSSDDDGGGGSGGSSGSSASGGSSGSSGTTNLPDPCELVTYDQLEAITGEELVSTELLTGITGDPSCTWFDATDLPVFQIGLWSSVAAYEFSADMPDSSPLSGIGEEAHLGDYNTVNVKLTTNGFFSQSLVPVGDGQISPEITAAASTEMQSSIAEYEASFRGAKLVIDAL